MNMGTDRPGAKPGFCYAQISVTIIKKEFFMAHSIENGFAIGKKDDCTPYRWPETHLYDYR